MKNRAVKNSATKNSTMPSGVRASFAEWHHAGVSLVAACGLFGVVAAGCDKLMQQPNCPALSSCGGAVPVGTWVLDPNHHSCSEDIYVAPTDPRLPMGTVPVARTPVLEPTLYDWCDQLITKAYDPKTGIVSVAANFYTPDIQVGGGSVQYNADGTYSAGLTRTGSYTLTFPALCMQEFGATPGNPAVDTTQMMPVGGPVDVCKQLELPLGQAGMGPGSFRNTACALDKDPSDQGGCVCTFDATETGGGGGTYLPFGDGQTILNLPGPGKNFPQKVTYCNTVNELQLTGTDGEYLFGTLGLRTLDLVPLK
jgi:hypothetical protein